VHVTKGLASLGLIVRKPNVEDAFDIFKDIDFVTVTNKIQRIGQRINHKNQ